MNFDSLSDGTVVTTGGGGIQFEGSPVVFAPGSNASSPPNALRRPGDCPDSPATRECSSGDHQLVMRFPNPARTVSLVAGNPAFPGCFEFSCPAARMAGFDADGDLVAISPWEPEGGLMNSSRIEYPVSIDAGAHVIARAVYSVSEDPVTGDGRFDSREFTAQIDDLTYDVLESGETPPPPSILGSPTVDITTPAEGSAFATTDVSVSGTFTAPAGIADTCLEANSTADFPTPCRQTAATASDGTFSSSRIPGMRPGSNTIRVWFRDTRGRIASDTVNVEVAPGDVDVVLQTMEVTQAVQVEELPAILGPDPPSVTAPGLGSVDVAGYDGVPLAEDKRTIVRIFGSARGGSAPLGGVPALLHAYRRDGGALVELPGSPIVPHGRPQPLVGSPDLGQLRAASDGGWTFTLPTAWTDPPGGELILAGELAPASLAPDLAAAECCRPNNTFALQGIEFSEVRRVRLYPVSLPFTDAAGTLVEPADPLPSYFEDLQAVFPAPIDLIPLPEVDITDIMDPAFDGDQLDAAIARLEETYGESGLRGRTLGLIGPDGNSGSGKGPGPFGATGAIARGLDFIAHEAGHQLGEAHAHDADAADTCTASDGTIQGVGIDPRPWSSGVTGHYQTVGAEETGVYDATPDAAPLVFDYMSYCSNETVAPTLTWMSTPYWATLVRELRPGGRVITDSADGCCFLGGAADPTVSRAASAVRGARRSGIHVSALIAADGSAELNRVETGQSDFTATDPASDVQVVVRDAAGGEISRTPVPAATMQQRPADGTPEPPPTRYVSAVVPGEGAARLDLVVGGVTVASRSASANVPTARLRDPSRGDRIGSKPFRVRWSSDDADGNPLRARVEFSADGGKTWKAVALNVTGGRARIDGSELPRTGKGQLRVLVNDGFHSAESVVKGIRTAGAKPEAMITSPRAGTVVQNDTPLVLEGQAHDDAGRPLAGRRLVWRSGKRKLGRGNQVDATTYEVKRKLKLIAKDRFGRVGRDVVRLKVRKAEPGFIELDPRRLGSRAKQINIDVAATVPGELVIRGKGVKKTRMKVSPRETKVRVITKGKRRDVYALKLRLKSQGKKTRQTLEVARGAR